MSNGSRQAVELIAVVNSVFKTIDFYSQEGEDQSVTAKETMEEYASLVDYGMQVCDEAISKYPIQGDTSKNKKRMLAVLKEVDSVLNGGDNMHSVVELVYMAHLILEALKERVRDPVKLEIIEPVYEAVNSFDDFINPDGDEYECMDEAEVSVKTVFKIIGF